jgi:CheY-like chemotaxis protein
MPDTDSSSRPLSILVVDDDEAVRKTLARIVAADGHRVIEASNGARALEAMQGAEIDLVITDVVMPEMEGLELLRRMRKQSDPPKVIVISGGGHTAGANYLELAELFGAHATMLKPISAAALRATIHHAMLD